ncbi:BglG family transcription antiterminator [Anaerocolumna sp. AGMB13025]|uniref:BglG family transcription antiterminator n=1 Tax=Anaerocolumna sp. AGMB13025 TaxID=3039116 RepID=UPI00241E4EA1|nr:BglG family transcription antiterminator [Anaerocolumna sp. AGMB13025]WFR55774.1 BglG family transcription antiterminator [Anaerocolumna sp. AGMB13025]
MKLTSRSKKIILLLLEEENYTAIHTIAERVNVSSRTVLRELNSIENWMNDNGILLEKKKGTGIRINIPKNRREGLKNTILREKADLTYSPEQRLALLKAELLKNTEITKLFTLTKLFDVTEGTISADLDKLVPWMEKYKLRIIKKPGLGVYVEGNEIAFRSAMISLIYEQFHEAEIINIIFNREKEELDIEEIKNRISLEILDITDIINLERIQKFLHLVERRLNLQFADNSFIALVIRISITIQRCLKGKLISGFDNIKMDVPKDDLFYLVKEWFLSPENSFPGVITQEEIKYMVIHIKGAEIQERHGSLKDTDEIKIYDLTKEVIYIAERETGIYLEDNERLLRGLAGHLKMAVYRIRMQLDIMNPLLEDIKEMYPELYKTAVKCAKFIEEKENIILPEDEIAYLATHIGAAVKEEKNNALFIYRAVLVCTNDIGVAQLLVSEIERVFTNIRISSIISVMDMDIVRLAQKHIDFIITTVELLVTELPTILVNPILNEADIKHIQYVLENFLPENKNYSRVIAAQLEDKVTRLKLYSDYVLQLIHNYLFIEQVAADSIMELNHFISRSLAKAGEDRKQIEKDLNNKQEKGSAILKYKGVVLYHLHSKAVRELGMTVIKLKEPMDRFDTFIFLSMPLNPDRYAAELINEVTRKIISSDFAMEFKQSSQEEIMFEINQILDSFIQNKVMETTIK